MGQGKKSVLRRSWEESLSVKWVFLCMDGVNLWGNVFHSFKGAVKYGHIWLHTPDCKVLRKKKLENLVLVPGMVHEAYMNI